MDQEQREAIGRQIKEARELRGWSPERLADEAEISVKTVRKLEIGGMTRPSMLAKVRESLDFEPIAERMERDTDSADVHAVLEVVRLVLNATPEDARGDAAMRVIRALVGDNGDS